MTATDRDRPALRTTVRYLAALSASLRIIIPMAALLAASPGQAAVFTVDTLVDAIDASPGDGVCATAAGNCSLRAAFQEANALPGADTVMLGSGTYALSIAGTDEDESASGDLDVRGELTLIGVDALSTRIDAGTLDRVLDILPGNPPASLLLEHVTLRNGMLSAFSAANIGAGMRVGNGAQVQMHDVVIRDNRLGGSGGVAIDSRGCVQGEHVRILDNGIAAPGSTTALSGGVALRGDGSCLHLTDSEISGNRGDASGALYTFGRSVVTIRRSLIANNSARFSGALELSMAESVLLENVTVSGNRGSPGAILNDGQNLLTLIHCTVTGNGPSGGVAIVGGIQDVHGGFGRTWLANTILSGNGPGFSADDCNAARSLDGGNLIGNAAHCQFASDPSDRFGVDPDLGPLADNGGYTRSHLPGAAAIDQARPGHCTDTDQRGFTRPHDGGKGCDIGAIEIQVDALFANGFDAATQ